MTVTAHSPAEPTESAAGESRAVRVSRASAVWILIAGVVGLAAALTLTVEKIEILINPNYVPSCSINPVLSCGSVMQTPQASAFSRCRELRSSYGYTATVAMPISKAARKARIAISPRLATRTLEIPGITSYPNRRGLLTKSGSTSNSRSARGSAESVR